MAKQQQPGEAVDVQAVLADLEQRVRQRRRLLGTDGGGGPHDDVRAVADNWFVSAHLPITWETPLIGRALALAKRATRLLLRWYINPIVDQQNDLNAAASRAFLQLTAQQEALTRAIAEVERRVAALEQGSGGAQGQRGGGAKERRSGEVGAPGETGTGEVGSGA